MTWIIVANAESCRIFMLSSPTKQANSNRLDLVREIHHPNSRLKDVDLVTDGPGHYKTNSSARGAYTPQTTAHDLEIQRFAKEIANIIIQGRTENAFKQLVLVSPPRFLGEVHQHMDEPTKRMIFKEIHKDYALLNQHELWQALHHELEHYR